MAFRTARGCRAPRSSDARGSSESSSGRRTDGVAPQIAQQVLAKRRQTIACSRRPSCGRNEGALPLGFHDLNRGIVMRRKGLIRIVRTRTIWHAAAVFCRIAGDRSDPNDVELAWQYPRKIGCYGVARSRSP